MTACSTFLSIYCGRLVHVSDHGQMIWISDEEMLQRPLLEVKKALQWYTNSLLMHAAMDHPMFEKSVMRYVKLKECSVSVLIIAKCLTLGVFWLAHLAKGLPEFIEWALIENRT
jgi:hypothetical protein